MMNLLGMPLERAERCLREAGVEPEIIHTTSGRGDGSGTPRVIRVQQGGSVLTVACFADQANAHTEEET